jgi:hypothetical protein
MSDEWSDTQLRIQAMELAVKVYVVYTMQTLDELANGIYHFLKGPVSEDQPEDKK